jgi:sigma-B regulation protein RsbU (phosphoserine phosphatase)
VGGDLWGIHTFASGQTLIYLGDVTGHGTLAGFFSATIAASLQSLLDEQMMADLDRLGRQINQWVVARGRGELLMTWCGILIAPDRQTAHILNAGQTFPLILRAGSCQPIIAQGNPMGLSSEMQSQAGRIKLERDDRILLYTDGITEQQSDLHGEFGERRLVSLFEQRAPAYPNNAELIDHIFNEVSSFGNGSQRIDDRTIVIAKIQ